MPINPFPGINSIQQHAVEVLRRHLEDRDAPERHVLSAAIANFPEGGLVHVDPTRLHQLAKAATLAGEARATLFEPVPTIQEMAEWALQFGDPGDLLAAQLGCRTFTRSALPILSTVLAEVREEEGITISSFIPRELLVGVAMSIQSYIEESRAFRSSVGLPGDGDPSKWDRYFWEKDEHGMSRIQEQIHSDLQRLAEDLAENAALLGEEGALAEARQYYNLEEAA